MFVTNLYRIYFRTLITEVFESNSSRIGCTIFLLLPIYTCNLYTSVNHYNISGRIACWFIFSH